MGPAGADLIREARKPVVPERILGVLVTPRGGLRPYRGPGCRGAREPVDGLGRRHHGGVIRLRDISVQLARLADIVDSTANRPRP